MNDNSYAGREYANALQENEIFPDIILLGSNSSVDAVEDWRCGNLWKPIRQDDFSSNYSIYRFDSLQDPLLISHLEKSMYALGIQGGTGILKNIHFEHFVEGMVSFHPGDLPFYRGCSAPEYQLSHGRSVTSTCHFIAEGIDVGDIIDKRVLKLDRSSFFTFRSTIYPRTAEFVVDIVSRWLNNEELARTPQNDAEATYYKYIGDDEILKLINGWRCA
jgi:methionyl-tRNA formyltransferase